MEKLSRLHADTITGSHQPLWFGWSDLQINTVADFLGLPFGNRRCIAAMVCSLVAAHLSDGVGQLRYSRRKEQYARNPNPDPLMTYRQVRFAADYLLGKGWAAGMKGGFWEGKQSIIWPTPELIELVADLVDVSGRAIPSVDEIILRDRGKKPVSFVDTEETGAMRAEMTKINESARALDVCLDGHRVHVPSMSRIFNVSFERGGRLYAQGPSWQNMPKDRRDQLTIEVNGRMTPTVEHDFSCLHPRLAYRMAGTRMPDHDAYVIPGFPRPLVKVAWNILVNADSRNSAVGAIADTLRTDPGLRRRCEISDSASLRKIADQVVTAIKRKHYRINDLFASDAGARLQRVDADMAVTVLLAMIERTGRCPLSLHDSFIVAECDEQALVEEMDRALSQAYSVLAPALLQGIPPTSPLHLGYRGSDQQQQDSGNSRQISLDEIAAIASDRRIATHSHGPPSPLVERLKAMFEASRKRLELRASGHHDLGVQERR